MEGVLWHLLASSRGGPNRVRIVRAVDRRPRNANELADALEVDYTTVRHHLDVLCENNLLEASGEEYGAVYLFTDQLRANRDVLDRVLETVDVDAAADEPPSGAADAADPGADPTADRTDDRHDAASNGGEQS